MKIHEYQAKNPLKKYGVAVPRGEMAETSVAAAEARPKPYSIRRFRSGGQSSDPCRRPGKGGGVKIAKSIEEAVELAGEILGMTLVTHQTGPEGRVVRRLLIEETLPIEKELYLGSGDRPRRGQACIHGVARGRNGNRASRGRKSCRDP